MKVRNWLAALVCVVSSAHAAGPYDGIYQLPSGYEWYSVHQNGAHLIVGGFWSYAGSPINYTLNNGQAFLPDRTDNWDLYGGPIDGNVAVVEGQTAFGACVWQIKVEFAYPRFTIIGVGTTARGNEQGINCAQITNNVVQRNGGTATFSLKRIF